jgi:uncharacterized protein (TIGR03546 family)
MIIAKFLLKFIKILNKEGSPKAIAGGLALGVMLGFVPKIGLIGLALMIFILMLAVNQSAALLAAAVVSAVAWIGDPITNRVGYLLLTAGPLQSFWTLLANTPVVPWTRFNNTLVMGGLAIGAMLVIPSYFVFHRLVLAYREKVLTAIGKWRIVQVLKASKIVGIYNDYR